MSNVNQVPGVQKLGRIGIIRHVIVQFPTNTSILRQAFVNAKLAKYSLETNVKLLRLVIIIQNQIHPKQNLVHRVQMVLMRIREVSHVMRPLKNGSPAIGPQTIRVAHVHIQDNPLVQVKIQLVNALQVLA